MATETKNLKIKLAKHGGKRPFYNIIVADSDAPRDGKFIERVGSYNPMLPHDGARKRLVLKADRIAEWLGRGAQPTDRVARFLSQYEAMAGMGWETENALVDLVEADHEVEIAVGPQEVPTVWYADPATVPLVNELALLARDRIKGFLNAHEECAGPGITSEGFSTLADAASTAFDDVASPVLTVACMAVARDRSTAGDPSGAVAALQVAEAVLLDRKHHDLLAVIHYRLADYSADLDPDMSSEYALRAAQSALEGNYPVLAERALRIAEANAAVTAC